MLPSSQHLHGLAAFGVLSTQNPACGKMVFWNRAKAFQVGYLLIAQQDLSVVTAWPKPMESSGLKRLAPSLLQSLLTTTLLTWKVLDVTQGQGKSNRPILESRLLQHFSWKMSYGLLPQQDETVVSIQVPACAVIPWMMLFPRAPQQVVLAKRASLISSLSPKISKTLLGWSAIGIAAAICWLEAKRPFTVKKSPR